MTRQELLSIPHLASAIALKSETLQSIRSAAYSLPSLQLGYRGQQGTHSDRVGTFAGRITDLEQELLQDTARLAELRLEAVQLLRTLPDPTQSVFQLRYMVGLTWSQISDETSIVERHCHRLHRKGLSTLFDDADAPGTNTLQRTTQDDN